MGAHWTAQLSRLGACHDGIEEHEQYASLKQAWRRSKRGDHMLWLLGRLDKSKPWSQGRKALTLCALDCARLTLPHAGDYRERIEREIVIIEAWARSKRASADKARAARMRLIEIRGECRRAYAAAADDAADAAAAAAAYSAADARRRARLQTLAKCATIVRRHFPTAPELGLDQ